jgi:hypothetical protein
MLSNISTYAMKPWFVLLLAPLTGCAAVLQDVTSGQIGCPAEQIHIVKDDVGWGTRTWSADCNGKIYFCSAHGGGSHSTAQVSCKEQAGAAPAMAPPGPPPPPPGGCQYDAQCKGDRVCKNGSCVDPTPK